MKRACTLLLLAIAPLATSCATGDPSTHAKNDAKETVLFMCPYGGAKSVMAASYFNRIAEVASWRRTIWSRQRKSLHRLRSRKARRARSRGGAVERRAEGEHRPSGLRGGDPQARGATRRGAEDETAVAPKVGGAERSPPRQSRSVRGWRDVASEPLRGEDVMRLCRSSGSNGRAPRAHKPALRRVEIDHGEQKNEGVTPMWVPLRRSRGQ